ncbi:RNA-binding protein [Puniceicoccales bacterium CK1056]|uniref:RNA-binding protein n=1 Tax=Oceanipulchritudo coccoides TaxID=2706888 RepID=A0A6B2M4V8_9BACT|nr:RNA-binding protein [Oceanipulchritudo coccoides]NDV63117.1 RNA-binding protein [Oceanipulchritudo coccoides]
MSTSLFVGNIPYGAMEREIQEHFSKCGQVDNVRFVMDFKRGRFRGFGFVTMPEDDAKAAVELLNQSEFQERQLIVSIARAS